MGTIRKIKIIIAAIGLIVMIAGFLIGTRWELKETLVYDDKGNMIGITTLKYYPSAELGLIITLVGGLLALLAILISLLGSVPEEPVVTLGNKEDAHARFELNDLRQFAEILLH
jgi:hypothetical protein